MAGDPRDASTELSTDALAEVALQEEFVHGATIRAQGPWRIAARRLRRNKVALAFLALFFVVVAMCLAAPIWANEVAKRGPKDNNEVGNVTVDGKEKDVVSPDGVPIGPTYQGEYFLGADGNGRDTAVRLLYGGRNSLLIGVTAALITSLLSVLLGIVAGYFGGFTDSVISRSMDVLWAFPVILLGVALGTALGVNGLKLGPITLAADSKAIPILIIGFVYVPYLARPIRGQVLALRQKEFVEAAEAQGAGIAADHVQRDPAQPDLHDHRVPAARGGQRDPAGGGAVVRWRRGAIARDVVGDHDRRGRGDDHLGPAPDDRARASCS